MAQPVLVVLAGRPGTGKTTLARKLAVALAAANLRIDAIETAVLRSTPIRPPLGPVGYVVAHEIAAATLDAGVSVVIDAVNPVAAARQGWRALASRTGARLHVFELVLADRDEHRRRVIQRRPDLDQQRIPSWAEVEATEYTDWDEARDGVRVVVDASDAERCLGDVLRHLDIESDTESDTEFPT